MPTCDRRPFVAQAIDYFLRQDYPRRELLIVDDGSDPVADLVPDDPRVRYLREKRRISLGAKRNLACREAKGEILVHWDDDDWHAPWRLSYQVGRLRESGAELCGLDRLYFWDPKADRAWQYVYPPGSRRWLAGGTLCYARSLWRRHPFAEVTVGEDNRFVRAAGGRGMAALEDGDFYVALIHPGNTSRKRPGGRRWQPVESSKIRALLGDDHASYLRPHDRPPAAVEPGESSRRAAAAAPERPLVSCIMPTYDRRRFVPDALRYFQRQDYPRLELLILDDGSDPIADLVPEDSRIRYLRLDRRHPLGAKRNLGCEAANGEIIAYWDEDDWYAPHRVSYQVAPLLAAQADLTVLGETLFYSYSSGEFWACAPELQRRMFHRGMVGGTQVFFKKLWLEGRRYPPRSLAEEIEFIKQVGRRGARVETLANDGVFVYGRHDSNSWKFTTGAYLDRRGWRRLERPAFLPTGDLVSGSPGGSGRESPKADPPDSRPGRRVDKRERAPAEPLVSCVMATGDRRAFLRQAIRYFQRQTYPNKELIIVDDGERSSADLVPDDSRIRYLRLESHTRLGKKLNLGIERFAGSILQKLDDDDYYHPEFLTATVSALLPHPPASAIVGLDSFLVLLAETGELKFSGRGYCAGASLCFSRELWQKRPFREIARGVDDRFLRDHKGVRRVKITNPELLIVVRHDGGHLWQKMGRVEVTEHFRRRPAYSKTLADCVEARDLAFYESLKTGRPKNRDRPAAASPAARLIADSRLPWSGWTLTRRCARRLLEHLEARPAKRILEAGSGISTVLLADYARRHRATLVSLEHLPQYLAATRDLLDRFALAPYADLRLAPLALRLCADGHRYPWYRAELAGVFDFVLIDGPPQTEGRQAALFALAPYLADPWHVWLHDGARPHEQACVDLWHRHFSFTRRLSLKDGRGILELCGTANTPRPSSEPERDPPPAEYFRLDNPGPIVPGLVTVVVPVYNCEPRLFRACLRSIAAQDFAGEIEVIVVDDGSEPAFRAAETAREEGVEQVISWPANQGACAARNAGWRAAKGELTLFFDADDQLRPAAIRTFFETLAEHPEAALCYSDFAIDGTRFEAGPFELWQLLRQNRIAVASMVRTREFVGFDPRIPRGMDWDAWLRMRKLGKRGVKAPGVLFEVTTDRPGRITDSVSWSTYRRIMRQHHPDLFPDAESGVAVEERVIVTAIVVYHNSQPWLEVLLKSLLKRRFSRDPRRIHLRVLLVENPCRDDSPRAARDFCRRFGKNSAIIETGLRADRFGGGESHAHGLMAGFKRVKPDSEWTLFLDSDIVILRDGWLDHLLGLGADMVGPPAFAHLKDYSVPHAHPSFLLFRTRLGKPPYWKGSFRHRKNPPDGNEYWDTAIPFTMAMGQRSDVKLIQLPQKRCGAGDLEYFKISDLAIHIRGVSNLSRRPKQYQSKRKLLGLPEVVELLMDEG